jgi:pimeloyl-ACP methyl ester carboxylesterase
MGIGNRIPIVLLPGMDGSGVMLRGLVERLASFRPVRVISFPNDRPLTYDELTAHVLERLPDGPLVLLGESFSGPIAIEIAAREQRVAGLVMAASFARHPMPALFSPLTRMLDLRWVPARLVETVLLGSAASLDLKETLRGVLATLPREVVRTRAAEVLRIDKRDRLHVISCPMLYLHARFDRLVSRKHRDEILASRPHCEVWTLDAPHMVLETHPVEAASIINGFCAQLA